MVKSLYQDIPSSERKLEKYLSSLVLEFNLKPVNFSDDFILENSEMMVWLNGGLIEFSLFSSSMNIIKKINDIYKEEVTYA